jgi:heme exporter protein D
MEFAMILSLFFFVWSAFLAVVLPVVLLIESAR